MSRCEKETRAQAARAREAGSCATVNRFSMPLKNAPPSAVIILIDTQARPRRPAVPLAYNALTLARAFARCRRYAPDRAPLDKAHVLARVKGKRAYYIQRQKEKDSAASEGMHDRRRHAEFSRNTVTSSGSNVTMTQSDRE